MNPSRSRTLRVGLLQIAFDEYEAFEARWARISDMVRAQRHHDLLVLPELWAHGAFLAGAWPRTAEPASGAFVRRIRDLAAEVGVVIHGGSYVERSVESGNTRMWNTSVVAGADGSLAATYRKIHRFGFGEGEPKMLEPGAEPTDVRVSLAHAGLATCYDLRFPELFRVLVDRGCELFLVPASWPAVRVADWSLLGRARALENQAFMIQVNAVGSHGGLRMGGGSQVVSPTGEVLAKAGDSEDALSVDIDLDEVERVRRDFPVLADRRVAVPRPEVASS